MLYYVKYFYLAVLMYSIPSYSFIFVYQQGVPDIYVTGNMELRPKYTLPVQFEPPRIEINDCYTFNNILYNIYL